MIDKIEKITLKQGLTLGKFAPLHKGHEYLIETAISEMDTVSIIIYDAPETTDIPLNIRAGWLRKLYPNANVIEAWDGPTDVGDTVSIRSAHENYIINTLGIKDITHFYSSEFYGAHMSVALNAIDRRVDEARSKFPISSTAIRKDPFSCKKFLSPMVYKDLITNVVFLGAPSTGKTTIAEKLARQLDTVWMPEYGREYWEDHQVDRRLNLDQLVDIAETHILKEDELILSANNFLFTDTNAITTYMFSKLYHGTARQRLTDLAQQARGRYDLVFLCDTDIEYADTWDRSGEAERDKFQKQIIGDLIERKIPYFLLSGSIQERLEKVIHILGKFKKFKPLPEIFHT